MNGEKLGFLIVSNSDRVKEDMLLMRPPQINIECTQIFSDDMLTIEKMRTVMKSHLKEGASSILKNGPLSFITFACTLGSIAIGEDVVISEISKGAPGIPATTAVTAVVNALQTLKAKNLLVIAPYPDDMGSLMQKYLSSKGFNIIKYHGLQIKDDRLIGKVEPSFICDLATQNYTKEIDTIFISCTSMPAIKAIQSIEDKLGIPVVTTNQAMLWNMLRRIGNKEGKKQYGHLFSEY